MERITEQEYLTALGIVKKYKEQIIQDLKEIDLISRESIIDKNIYIEDYCSATGKSGGPNFVRLVNGIRGSVDRLGIEADYKTSDYGDGFVTKDLVGVKISSLEGQSIRKISSARNIGKKAIELLIQICKDAGVALKP